MLWEQWQGERQLWEMTVPWAESGLLRLPSCLASHPRCHARREQKSRPQPRSTAAFLAS